MKRLFLFFILILMFSPTHADLNPNCKNSYSFSQWMCTRWNQIWDEGKTDLILSGYAWHNRWTYRPEKIESYNELAWGAGFAKDFFDEKGNEHGLYVLAFLDSHENIEPVIGYVYLKTAHFNERTSLGLGLTGLITMRPDINNGAPFPGILPWVAFNYRRTSIMATYIPGARGAGNVLLILGKIVLDYK